MNSTALWRCFWREYRCGRSFWLAIALLTFCMQLAWHFGNRLGQWGASPAPLQAMSLTMPLVYVVAWAATSFNREQETGVFARLQELPLSFVPLWAAKLGFTLTSAGLLAAVVMLVAAWLGGIPEENSLWVPFSRWIAWLLAAAGIGSVCSQWIKRPLAAVFVAGAGFVIAALWSSNDALSFAAHFERLSDSVLLPVLGAVALIISLPLTRPWLEDQMTIGNALRAMSFAGTATSIGTPGHRHLHRRLSSGVSFAQTAATASIGGRGRSQLGRHLWVSWRRLGLAASIPLAVALLSLRWAFERDASFSAVVGFILLFAWPWMLGATLFYCEQDTSHARFLMGQGVSPARVWCLRQLIGGVFFLVSWIGLYLIVAPQLIDPKSQVDHTEVRAYLTFTLLAYVVSQFVSITLRSRLVGLALSALLTLLFGGWAWLMTGAGIPAWISVGLPAAALLYASRLRAEPFLLEWNHVRHWWAPATVLAGGLVASIAAVVTFRVTEIPRVPPPLDIAAFTESADAKFNAAAAERILATSAALSSHAWPAPSRYSSLMAITEQTAIAVADQATDWKALPLHPYFDEQRALADARELLTPELEQALASAYGLLPSRRWRSHYDDLWHVVRLGQLFVMRARQRETIGELDAAGEDYRHALRVGSQLRRYGSLTSSVASDPLEKLVADNLIFWAVAPGQDTQRVTAMIDWLVARQRDELSRLTPLRVDYVNDVRFVDGLPQSLSARSSYLRKPTQAGALAFLSSLPGERARLRRLVDARASVTMARFEQAVGQRMAGMTYSIENDEHARWSQTTPLAFLLDSTRKSYVVDFGAQQERQRMALLARLALIRQFLVSGKYPESFGGEHLPPRVRLEIQSMFPSTHRVAVDDRLLNEVVKYSQALEAPLHERLIVYSEPLGQLIVNAAGSPAIIIGGHVYPLPVTGKEELTAEEVTAESAERAKGP